MTYIVTIIKGPPALYLSSPLGWDAGATSPSMGPATKPVLLSPVLTFQLTLVPAGEHRKQGKGTSTFFVLPPSGEMCFIQISVTTQIPK